MTHQTTPQSILQTCRGFQDAPMNGSTNCKVLKGIITYLDNAGGNT